MNAKNRQNVGSVSHPPGSLSREHMLRCDQTSLFACDDHAIFSNVPGKAGPGVIDLRDKSSLKFPEHIVELCSQAFLEFPEPLPFYQQVACARAARLVASCRISVIHRWPPWRAWPVSIARYGALRLVPEAEVKKKGLWWASNSGMEEQEPVPDQTKSQPIYNWYIHIYLYIYINYTYTH
jgi:hypothetical protein